jgi:hypothetical protein
VSSLDNINPIESERDFEGSERIQIEVVDEIPPPNFNPPLTGPFDPVLLRVGEHFSEPFSLFNNPHMMFGMSDSSSKGVPTTSSSSVMKNTLVMSSLPSIKVVGPTPYMPSAFTFSI